MIFITRPAYYEMHRYHPDDSPSHALIIGTVGQPRLQWRDNGVLLVHAGLGDEAAWVHAYEGDWVGVCEEFGCAHVMNEATVTEELQEVHQR